MLKELGTASNKLSFALFQVMSLRRLEDNQVVVAALLSVVVNC